MSMHARLRLARLANAFLLSLLPLLPPLPHLPLLSAQSIVITHAVVIDGNGAAPIEDGTVVIRDGKILAVGSARTVTPPAAAQVIDARGKVVMPGLADMHVHLTGGWDGEAVDFLGYRRYLNSLLYAGVTTVLDTGNNQPYILQLRQEVAAGRLLGPRIYCAGGLIDGPDPLWPPISFAVSSAAQVPRLVRQQKADRVDILKAYHGLSVPILATLVAEGRKDSLRVFVDQGQRNGSADLLRVGIAAWAHTPRFLSEEALALMVERRVHTITTLVVSETGTTRRFAQPAFMDDPLFKDTQPPWFIEDLKRHAAAILAPEAKARTDAALSRLQSAFRIVKRLHDAGLLLAAGTDAPYPGDIQGEGLHRELELLVEAGLTPLQAITVATKNAAILMNAEREWGTLEPGRTANVLIVNGRPDRTIGDTRKLDTVILAGRVLNRQSLKFDASTDPGFRVGSSAAEHD